NPCSSHQGHCWWAPYSAASTSLPSWATAAGTETRAVAAQNRLYRLLERARLATSRSESICATSYFKFRECISCQVRAVFPCFAVARFIAKAALQDRKGVSANASPGGLT